MPAIRDFTQGYHATTTYKHVQVPTPNYEANDLLLAILSIDDSAGVSAQTFTGGMPSLYTRYDDGTVFTNYDVESNNETAADFYLVPAAPAVNDAFYIGYASPFSGVNFMFSTQGAGTWTCTWEYWTGAAWATVNTPSDGTTSWKAATTVHAAFTHVPQSNWAANTVNGVSAYWVRSRVSAYTSITTRPIGSQLWVIPVETSGASGWKQLFTYYAGTTPAPTGAMWKMASASEPVATTFFYGTAETANAEMISIRDVAQVHDSGSAALTVNVVAASKTFTRTTGSWVTDGFQVNDTIDTSGFTNGGNNTTKIIQSITTTTNANDTITVTSATGLVNESGNNNERVVSTPFNSTKYANSNAATSKMNLPTMTTDRNDCLLVWLGVPDTVSVPSIIEGACQLIAGKDGSAHSDGCAWGFQHTAGTTPTVGLSQTTAYVTEMAVIAVNPPAQGTPVIPGYCSADSSVYVSPFTGAAFNSDSVPAATITTPFTGTINGRPLANGGSTVTRADVGINSYHAACGFTGVTTSGSFGGIRATMVARTTLANKNILFHVQPYLPVDMQTTDSMALPGACGVAIGLASTTGNFKVWHVAGYGTSWGVQRHQPVVVNTGATAGLLQTTGTFDPASITEIGLMVSSKIVAANWMCMSIWALDTCTIAGGCTAEPLELDAIVFSYADGHERRSAIRQGAKQALFLGPVQIGDGGTNPVVLNLDATAIEFPRQYSKTLKEIYYNSTDNVCGLIYYAGSSDVITHKNSVVSSPSRYKWGLHSSASASATYDFSGLSVIGAGTITLNKAITVTGLTINDYSTIDATGLTFDQGVIKGCPVGNASITTTSATLIKRSTIDVSGVTAGNYWSTTTTPVIFEDNAFTGGGGHAIRITTAGTYTFKGNTFASFGADGSTSAAIFNDSGGLVTLNISGGGGTPTVKNGSGASTVVNVPIDLTINIVDASGNPIDSCEVTVVKDSDTTVLHHVEDAISGTTLYSYSSGAGTLVYINVLNVTGYTPKTINNYTLPSSSATLTIQLDDERMFANPA